MADQQHPADKRQPKDERKTKKQLVAELVEMRQRFAELEATETARVRSEDERAQAEEALRESERRYRALFEHSNDGVFIFGLDGIYIAVNQRGADMLGYGIDELIGKSAEHTIAPDQRQDAAQKLETLLAEQSIPLYERTFRARDGTLVPAEINLTLVRDDEGRPVCVQSIARDITERVRTEEVRQRAAEEVRKSGERYRTLFESVPVGLYRTTPDGRILHANPALVQMLGYPDLRTLTAANVTEDGYVSAEERQRWQATMEREGGVSGYESQWRCYDGTTIWVRETARVIRDIKGRVSRYDGAVEDVTERVRSEEERARAVERIEHLNAVLRAIRSVNQLIVRERDRDRLLQDVCESLIETRGYHNAWIALLDEEGGLVRTAEAGLGEEFLPLVERLERGELTACGRRALEQPGVVATQDPLSACTDCPLSAQYADRGAMTIRLEHRGRVYGFASVSIPVHLASDEEEMGLFEEVAGDIALALHSMELEEERTQAEEALREQNEFVTNMFESLTHPFYVIDADDYTIKMANSAARMGELSELSTCYTLTHKRDQPCSGDEHPCPLEIVKATRKPSMVEHLHYDEEGNPRHVEVYGYPVFDREGHVVQMIEYALDITERKQAEAELLLKDLVFEYSIAANSISDNAGVITHVNDTFIRLWGYESRNEAIGKPISDFLKFEDEATSIITALNETGVWDGEYTGLRKDGTTFAAHGLATIIKDRSGDSIGYQSAVLDISDRKQMERQLRQQERLAAVGQLAGGIAHDFNNLLTTILLYAQMPMSQPDLPPVVERAFETILNETRRAAELVQQILDFSRRSSIETHPLDLALFLKEAISILERTIPESITLQLEIEPGEYVVSADPTRIQQVVLNLALNARDAMPEGGEMRFGLSRVTVGPEDVPPVVEMEPGEWVCLAVSDTGAGILPEVLPHVFEPFFTTKEEGRGTGLGLAQVHGIVGQHGGHTGVETEPGRGTTFRIYLPAHGEEMEQATEEGSASPRGRGETILLVEDEENVREAGQGILESLGYRVVVAADGQEALDVYRSAGTVDLVITDIVMPEMGGRTLMQELKKADPHLRILAITGYALTGDLEALKEEGFLNVVQKPFDMDGLARAARRALDAD
jgi:PAS domain S-box-containing protein